MYSKDIEKFKERVPHAIQDGKNVVLVDYYLDDLQEVNNAIAAMLEEKDSVSNSWECDD